MKKQKRFKFKILRVFFLISILPLLIISASSLYIVVSSGQKNIIELQNLAIDNTSEKVQKFLNEKMDMFNLVVSGTPKSLRDIDMNNLNYLIDNLRTMAGDVSEISFINRDGVEIVKRSLVGGTRYNNVREREDFQTAFSGKNYIGEVVYEDGISLIRLSSQIENSDREVIGVISALVSLKSLDAVIEHIKLGESGFIYLIDQNGKFISSSRSDYLPLGKDLSDVVEVKNILSKKVKDKEGLNIYKNSIKEEVVLASGALDEYRWFVISEWPKNDAYQAINHMIIQSLLIIIITITLVIIFGLITSRQIIRPIKVLSNGVNKISEGDLEYKIELPTGDEFEKLAKEFNKMTDVLKENSELRDEFVFIAAHELRTPVTAIKGYVAMILSNDFGKISENIQQPLRTVEGANNRLVQLVQDLLQVARSEAGKMIIELKSVNIKNNINNVAKELKSLSDEKNITVNYKDPGKNVVVLADDNKLNEVIINIIGNAIKYTLSDGSIDIFHEVNKDKNILVTHIKDHGIGMKEEDMEKLFSKFYRVQTEKTAKIEGTGLGLFICREIIERMGGKIWVESDVGAGSTFSFSLKTK